MTENSKDQKDNQSGKRKVYPNEELKGNRGLENASGNFGGTTDMDDEAIPSGTRSTQERGSGISTKKNITGSDYDGQVPPK